MISKKMRVCGKCGESKSETYYHKNKQNNDGLHTWCRECRIKSQSNYYVRTKGSPKKIEWQKKYRSANKDKISTQIKKNAIRRKYGITLERYSEILFNQGNKCLICGAHIEEHASLNSNNKAHLDHCHDTGEIRGFLCPPCNKGLGSFRDNVGLLLKAADYLIARRILHHPDRLKVLCKPCHAKHHKEEV